MRYCFKKVWRSWWACKGGFSLVEVALALLIVGIMLGAIMKGQQIYEGAKLQTIINQVDQIRIAHLAFVDRYGALPGDYDGASIVFESHVPNGDGDGIIAGRALQQGADTTLYWQHLAAAQLLHLPYVQGVPTSRCGGVFTIEHDSDQTGSRAGVWVTLGNITGDYGDAGLLTPQQAYLLNKKHDDGGPETGMIRSETGRHAANACIVPGQNRYNLTIAEPVCVMYFKIA